MDLDGAPRVGIVGGGQLARMTLRVLGGEVFAIFGVLLLINWMRQRWLRSVLMDELDVTLLNDGEICHGLWVSHVAPLLRILEGIAAGEMIVFLIFGIRGLAGAGLSLATITNSATWFLLPPVMFLFHAYTLRMLGPRFLFAAVQGPAERNYLAMAGVMLAECYGVLLLIVPIIAFTAFFAALLLSLTGGSGAHVVALTFLLVLSLFKRDVSESYHTSMQANWRAWLSWQRDFVRTARTR